MSFSFSDLGREIVHRTLVHGVVRGKMSHKFTGSIRRRSLFGHTAWQEVQVLDVSIVGLVTQLFRGGRNFSYCPKTASRTNGSGRNKAQLPRAKPRISSIHCGPSAGQDRGRRFYKSLLALTVFLRVSVYDRLLRVRELLESLAPDV